MDKIKRVILWTTLASLGLLIGLSMVGSCMGDDKAGAAEHAKAMFNSAPVVLFWFFLAGLLLIGFLYFPRLIKSPGLLMAHLGSLLILGGAMYSSDRGHLVAARLLGVQKVPSGRMVIGQGESTADILGNKGEHIGRLPFEINLNRFWIDYYPLKDSRWQLLVQASPTKHGQPGEIDQLDVTPGNDVAVPFSNVRLQVLQYFEHAKTMLSDVKPHVEITAADGKTVDLPAVVGQAASLDNPAMKIAVEQVFRNMVLQDNGHKVEPIDAPGSGGMPAVVVKVEQPTTQPVKQVVYPGGVIGHGAKVPAEMRYVLPEPVGAVEDSSSELPAMKVRITDAGTSRDVWLLPQPGQDYIAEPLVHDHPTSAPAMGDDHGRTVALIFARPQPEIRHFNSDLSVTAGGSEKVRKTIRVNDPLHYGGYHFYQSDYDHESGQYTILSVHSDSGLTAVLVGFALLVLGLIWQCWARPAWRYFFNKAK